MKDQSNNQPGAQRHAEGEYGDVARKANQERLETPRDGDDTDDADGDVIARSGEGRHHIYEDRQQHDEADKNAEKNRVARDQSKGRKP